MSKPADKTPGAGLVALLLAAGIVWTGAARLARPIARVPGDEPPPQAALNIADRWPDMRLDLNTATAAELAMLPGIGPRLAERIVFDRAANRPFRSRADLARVRGIGPVVVERIGPYVVAGVEPEAAAGPAAEP